MLLEMDELKASYVARRLGLGRHADQRGVR